MTLALLLLPLMAAEAPSVLVTSFSGAEVGADSTTWCATQAADGTLLFGSNALLTFDHEHWTTTPVPGAYCIRHLDFGRDGRLWVAAVGDIGYFERLPDLSWKFHSLRASLPADLGPLGDVWRVYAENEGAIFVTTDRILRWTGREFETWSMPDTRRLLGNRVDGRVYVHYVHPDGGIFVIGPKGPEPFLAQSALDRDTHSEPSAETAVLWMASRGADWLLLTQKGLYLLRDGRATAFAPDVSDYLRRMAPANGTSLPDGRYAFTTLSGGIVLMQRDGRLDRVLDMRDGLPTRSIAALFVDHEGGLWATSQSHIFHIEMGTPTIVFDERAGLPMQSYYAVTRLGSRLMVGSENGVFEYSPADHSFHLIPELNENVHDMRTFPGRVLVGMRHGAKQISDRDIHFAYTTKSDVIALGRSRRSPDHVIVSESGKVILVKPDGSSRVLVQDPADSAVSIAEDDRGNLWLATIARGVLVARPDPKHPVTAASPAPEAGLPPLQGRTHVRATADGAILAFADNGGWIKPAGASAFRPIENYPARAAGAVSEFDADGTGWVAHLPSAGLAAGVARIRVTGDRAVWQPHSVIGLPRIGFPRSILADRQPDGSSVLWIGGTKSVLHHVVAGEPLAPTPRPPVLHAFARDAKTGELRPIAGALPYSTPSVEFTFASPDFSQRESLRLQTFIDGIDRDWMPADAPRRVLPAPRDGSYTFRVRSVAGTGVASAPTTFSFEVSSPFWRTPFLLACVLLTSIPIGYGLYVLRIRTLRRRTIVLEAKVRQRTEELEQANAAKTQFVANMSHDIRNPLNGIVGLTLALEDTRLDSRQREIVATLRECTTYLSSLVDDVLDFASIEAGRVELRPGPFAPQELLRSLVETLKADTAESGAQLVIEAAPSVPSSIVGDPGRIQQILVNFVSNALKYAGGEIRLVVGIPPGAPDEIEFAVIDHGAGIGEAEQAVLFKKFSRLKQTRGGENIPGAGLGLASCRLLADLMGGSVGVESRLGEGARFFLRLPLTIATAAPEPAAGSLPNATVLLVEDTDYNAWAATAVLRKLGLSCERARDGAEALRLFVERRFNVVLLDRNLPDMDGTEVARRIREMESGGPPALLLAVTAYCTAEDRARCLEAGMDAFVGKPLTPDKLRRALLAASRQLLATATLRLSDEKQSPAPSAAPRIDLLDALANGTREGLDAEIGRYLSALDDLETQLVTAIAARDFARISTAAHNLRTHASIVGADTLNRAAWEIESDARADDAPACEASLPALRSEIAAVRAAMRPDRPALHPR